MTSTENPETPETTETASEVEPLVLSLSRFPETLAVVRLGPGADVPDWAESSSLFGVVATATQTTLVCAGRSVPRKVPQRKPFIAFSAEGVERTPGDLAVLVAMLAPLTEDALEAVVLPTFDTDWVLVPAALADRAEEAWRRSGHTVAPAVPV